MDRHLAELNFTGASLLVKVAMSKLQYCAWAVGTWKCGTTCTDYVQWLKLGLSPAYTNPLLAPPYQVS